jgi:hypothetical protein
MPISTDPRQAESLAGIRVLEGMKLQTVAFRYKRGFRHACICHPANEACHQWKAAEVTPE